MNEPQQEVQEPEEQPQPQVEENENPSPSEEKSRKPVLKTRKSLTSKFGLGDNLDSIEITKEEKKDEEVEEETADKFELDPSINIDPHKFEEVLSEIIGKIKAEGNVRLSFLTTDLAEIQHNKWIQVVRNHLQLRQLEEEKWIIAELREKLGVHRLFSEFVIVPPDANAEKKHLSPQEKLDVMKDKNPELNDFLKRFNASIKWD